MIEHAGLDQLFTPQYLAKRLPKVPRGRARSARVLDQHDRGPSPSSSSTSAVTTRASGRGHVEVCRPGKPDGCSATVGALGSGAIKVWSKNWPDLPAGVYGLRELRGLWSASRDRGFASHRPRHRHRPRSLAAGSKTSLQRWVWDGMIRPG